MRTTLVLGTCLLGTICVVAQQPRFDGQSLWRHVQVLAADDMEGRETGTPGLERAQAYVVDQLKEIGLAPAGTDGYFQPVSIVRREIVDNDCSAALVRGGRVEPLTLGEDAACTTFVDMASTVDAPLAFLGYGLKIPEAGYDDFAGLDLKGKIAVTIPGVPGGVDPRLAAHAVNRRWDDFRDAGLVGWIFMTAPAAQWTPLFVSGLSVPRLHLAGNLDETHGQQIFMYFNPAHAETLFAGTGHTSAELFALNRDRQPLPHFTIPASLRATARMANRPVASSNVVAKLEGSDPQLRNEYVVLSAHLDHVGIGQPVNGDRIYNGAIDNASGVAAVLDVMTQLQREGVRPKRSVLLTFFTGEERGHLGSKYFVAHPTVDFQAMVGNLNVDVVNASVPLKAVAFIGLEESDLGDAGRRVAMSQSVPVDVSGFQQPNPIPSQSDQASFMFAGIPFIKLMVGSTDELRAEMLKYRQTIYHSPSDDLQQAVNLETFARYEEVLRALLLEVANNPRRPEWKPSSLYRRYVK